MGKLCTMLYHWCTKKHLQNRCNKELYLLWPSNSTLYETVNRMTGKLLRQQTALNSLLIQPQRLGLEFWIMVVQKPVHLNQKATHLNSKKTDIINWLSEHNKPQSDETMELNLYQFILIYKLFYTNFSMDQMCSNYGHINLIYPLMPQWHEYHNNLSAQL